jgi:hypothetical protein
MATIEDVKTYLVKHFTRVSFTDKQIQTAIDLSIRRGNETRGTIVKDAINFLYC